MPTKMESKFCRTKEEYRQAIQEYHLLKPRLSIDLSDSEDELRKLGYELDNLLLDIYNKSI